MKKNYIIILIAIILLLGGVITIKIMNKKEVPKRIDPVKFDISTGSETNFDYKMIKQASSHYDKNYMISPLSIAYALSILEKGSTDNTKTEIDNALEDYKLLNIVNVKDRISLANLLFINKRYESDIKKTYIDEIKKDFDSDLIIDEFKTPDKVNNWISDKTFGMLKDVLDNINPNTMLGIANALAIDVEWDKKFECTNTRKEEFTLSSGRKIDSAIMHSSNDVSYFKLDNAEGIVKDYKIYNYKTGESYNWFESVYAKDDTIALEYIAILPDNINDFINKFDANTLNNIKSNLVSSDSKRDINLSLPKYTYDFDYTYFKNDLINLGIKDAFDAVNASFKNISDKLMYVSDAIHKSHIELSENGTKAAAVTVFILKDNAMAREEEKEIINIKFNKPFIYLIKEKNSNNIWFFGTVYEPMKFENDKMECNVQ